MIKLLFLFRSKDAKFAHITDEEINKAVNATKEAHKWLEQTRGALNASVRHQPPPVTCAQIRTEHQNFEQTVSPILNKPAPKPQPPKEEKSDADNGQQQQQQPQQNQNQQEQNNQQQAPPEDDKMDCS